MCCISPFHLLMDFSVLVQITNLGPRSFPLTGLSELEPDWEDTVIEIIAKPPVSRILKVSVYTPSLVESVPIALVEKLPVSWKWTTLILPRI